MNLMSDKIDRATRCGNENANQTGWSAKAGCAGRPTPYKETVDRTAERIRDKLE